VSPREVVSLDACEVECGSQARAARLLRGSVDLQAADATALSGRKKLYF